MLHWALLAALPLRIFSLQTAVLLEGRHISKSIFGVFAPLFFASHPPIADTSNPSGIFFAPSRPQKEVPSTIQAAAPSAEVNRLCVLNVISAISFHIILMVCDFDSRIWGIGGGDAQHCPCLPMPIVEHFSLGFGKTIPSPNSYPYSCTALHASPPTFFSFSLFVVWEGDRGCLLGGPRNIVSTEKADHGACRRGKCQRGPLGVAERPKWQSEEQ